MDNLSHITPAVISAAIAALVRGRNRILGEYGGYGCESTIYEIDAAIAELKGEEYVRVPVGNDFLPVNPVHDDAGLLALARAAYLAAGREWGGEAGFGLAYDGKVVATGFEPEEGGETLAPFDDSVVLCESTEVSESLRERLFQASCRNEWFGLME